MKQKPMLVALVATTAIALCCAAGLAYTVHSIRQYEKKNSVSILFAKSGNSVGNSPKPPKMVVTLR